MAIQKSFCSLLLLTCLCGCGAAQTESEAQVLQEQLTFPETSQEALERLENNNILYLDATISEGGHGNIHAITNLISAAIDGETDPTKAQILNVENSILQLQSSEIITDLVEEGKVTLVGGIYDTHTGEVQFLE